MVSVKIYVEGAGPTELERSYCQRAFSLFFASAGIERRPRTVACGGRGQAYDAFLTAMKARKPGELPLLLVDSEEAIADGRTSWQHLKSRDGWDKPAGVSDDQVFLMVQVMETWFVADRKLLEDYFGKEWRGKHLAAWPVLEDVPKVTIIDALSAATAGCKKKYAKGKCSFELLGRLDAQKVEMACPGAKRLLDYLRSL